MQSEITFIDYKQLPLKQKKISLTSSKLLAEALCFIVTINAEISIWTHANIPGFYCN